MHTADELNSMTLQLQNLCGWSLDLKSYPTKTWFIQLVYHICILPKSDSLQTTSFSNSNGRTESL